MKNVFKQMATYDNYLLANMTLGLLQEHEIHCHLRDENIVTIDPFLSPAVGGIKLMVEEADFNKAQILVRQAEADYLLELPCPHCKSHSLVVEEKTIAPVGLWNKLKNIAAYGQTDIYTKKYRCTNCKMVYDNLPASF